MSKTILEIVCLYSKETSIPLGLVVSRRQIDGHKPGYVGWSMLELRKFLIDKPEIIVERDHGGPGQSDDQDDGYESLMIDVGIADIIHIDVWKIHKDINRAIAETAKYIRFCYNLNKTCKFEVGTEEGIRPYSTDEFDFFLGGLYKELGQELFNTIVYAVIQSGTKIKGLINTGNYNLNKMIAMIKICKNYSLMSKEHNADYLPVKEIKERYANGLTSLNIAPQVASIENGCLLKFMSDQQKEKLLDKCAKSSQYQRWFGCNKVDPLTMLKALAHYFREGIFLSDEVFQETKNELYDLFNRLLK